MGRSVRAAFIVALGGLIFGLDAVLISGGNASIRSEFQLTDSQLGWVVSAAGWGVLPALLVVGPLVNWIGRKHTLILIAAMYVISAVTSVISTDWLMLAYARALGGMAFTSLSVASMYIGEIAPPQVRGKMVSVNQLNIGIGIFLAFLINWFIANAAGEGVLIVNWLGMEVSLWRWMLGVEIIPAIIWLVLLLGIPKSPRWLYGVGRADEAREMLALTVPADKVESTFDEIKNSSLGENSLGIIPSIVELCTTHLGKAMLIGLLVAILQPLTGINNLLYYAPIVFEQSGSGTNAAFQSTIAIGVIAMVATGVAILIIDRVGRRPLLSYGLAAAAICLLLAGWGFSQASYVLSAEDLTTLSQGVPIDALQPLLGVEYGSDVAFKNALVEALGLDTARQFEGELIKASVEGLNAGVIIFGLLGFVAAFNVSIGPIMWVLFSEVFPTRVRGIAIAACALVTSLVSAGLAKVFPQLLAESGASNVFLMFGGIIAIGLVAVYFLVPETKNKSIEEIEALFKGGKAGA